MNWSAGLAWLATLNPRRRADAANHDGGDMGTAFGLDASFQSFDDESEPAAAPHPAPLPWEYRLVRRRGL